MKWLAKLCVFLCLVSSAHARIELPPRYNLSVCSLFCDETPHLIEWIEYHRLVGVDHFYLYNNGSRDRPYELLKPYVQKGIVSLVEWSQLAQPPADDPESPLFCWSLGVQIPAYEHALAVRAKRETRWIAFLDIDEFLVPASNIPLKEYLRAHEDVPGFTVATQYFDASEERAPATRHLTIEAIQQVQDPPLELLVGVAKEIFQPTRCSHFTWPPYTCCFKDDQKPVPLGEGVARINKYVNRGRPFHKFIFEVKGIVPRSALSGQTRALLDAGYAVQDPGQPILRFVPALKKQLSLSSN